MSKIEKMATIFAKEMVEHNLMNGAVRLDLEYIANEACELAYKIHEKAKSYGHDESKPLTEKHIHSAVEHAMEKYKEDMKPKIHHIPNQH